MSYHALLIDDDTGRLPALRRHWQAVFQEAGMDVRIETSDTFEVDAHQLESRPHFFIVDNVMDVYAGNQVVDEIENRGIDFIAATKKNHTDSVFLLSTQAQFSIDVLGHKFPNPDLIVPKTALASDAFRANLAILISERVNRAPFGRLNIPDPDDAAKVEEYRHELMSILEQCISAFSEHGKATAIRQVNIESLGGGFSGAAVFRVRMFDSDNRKKVPLVLKLSKGTGASREVSAYNAFVRLNVPHDMRVDLLGHGEAGEYKGALYAFAFGDTPDLFPLATAIGRSEYEKLDWVIQDFFMSEQIGWYRSTESARNAEDFFSNSEEYSYSKDSPRLSQLKSHARRIVGEPNVTVSLERCIIGSFAFPFPRKQLPKFENVIADECVCHGDFNSNNVIFGRPQESAAVIDFEYSGNDLLYKDFVSLECSLRIDDVTLSVNSIEEFSSRCAEELSLSRGNHDEDEMLMPYADAVLAIRAAAAECAARTGREFCQDLYILAMSFHLLKLLGVKGLPTEPQGQLLACFAACGVYLDEI